MSGAAIKFGRVQVALLVLIAVGFGFVGGSAVFDALFLRQPSGGGVLGALNALPPYEIHNFEITAVTDVTSDKLSAGKIAKVSLSLKSPLYARSDFLQNLAKRGDDTQGFAEALARWQKLPQDIRIGAPVSGPAPALYALEKSPGEKLEVEVRFTAEKFPRGWSLRDCLSIWLGLRRWNITDVRWPKLPENIQGLIPRDELPSGARLVGERMTEEFLAAHVERRRTYMAGVAQAEAQLLERTATASIEQEVARAITPAKAFVLKTVRIIRPQEPIAADGKRALDAEIVIEQVAELFREEKQESVTPIDPAVISAYQTAQKTVADFHLDAGPVPKPPSAYFISVSPGQTQWNGKLRCSIRGPSEAPIVEKVVWLESPAWPTPPLLLAESAPAQAIFVSKSAGLRSMQSYRLEIEAFVSKVQSATTRRNEQWGSDRAAWQVVEKAITAHGGREALIRAASYTALVAGTRTFPDGRQFQFRGTRNVSPPFRFRDDYSFTGEKLSFTQIEALDRNGAWRQPNGKMRSSDIISAEGVINVRRQFHAANLLWYLAVDQTRPYVLAFLPGGATPRVSVTTPDFPAIEATFDAEHGYLTSARYVDNVGDKPKNAEWRFSAFKVLGGAARPTHIEFKVNGENVEVADVSSVQLANFGAEFFRNPFSSGIAFRGDPNGAQHQVMISNLGVVGALLVCIDDSPETVALGFRDEQTIRLPAGEHEFRFVGWVPQISIKEPQKIETKPARIRVVRDFSINVTVDRGGLGSLQIETK